MRLFDDSEAKKAFENVLTENTFRALYELADDGHFDVLHGFVKEGKESVVAVAEKGEELLAVKIYVIEASNYQDMQQYLRGDPRFDGISNSRRDVVFSWCRKEFRNLQVAGDAGLRVPTPVAGEDNVLLMEFLGEDFRPAPRLVDIALENPETALDQLLDAAETLWRAEGLVHADLSPYNVLVWEQQLYVIDFSQAVLSAHPRAEEFLRHDVETLLTYFRRRYDIDRDPDTVVNRISE